MVLYGGQQGRIRICIENNTAVNQRKVLGEEGGKENVVLTHI